MESCSAISVINAALLVFTASKNEWTTVMTASCSGCFSSASAGSATSKKLNNPDKLILTIPPLLYPLIVLYLAAYFSVRVSHWRGGSGSRHSPGLRDQVTMHLRRNPNH